MLCAVFEINPLCDIVIYFFPIITSHVLGFTLNTFNNKATIITLMY